MPKSPYANITLDPRYEDFVAKFHADPMRFAVEVTGFAPSWDQEELFAAITPCSAKVSVVSGTGTGKTASYARIALWHLLAFPFAVYEGKVEVGSNTYIGAPLIQQVADGVWKEMQDARIAIAGSGLAGLSLACALRDSRLKIALVESTSPPARAEGWDARVYAVTPANAAFLDRIGVWKHLDIKRICPIHAMRVCGDRAARLDFSAYESGIDELGWILESSLMACELWENVKRQKNVSLFFGATPNSLAIEHNAAALTLASGHVLSAQLVIGADGRNSWVRSAARLPAHETSYDEMGVVANFSCEKPSSRYFRMSSSVLSAEKVSKNVVRPRCCRVSRSSRVAWRRCGWCMVCSFAKLC